MTSRLAALRELAAADPDDLLARYLLGKACLDEGLVPEAIEHLSLYCDRFEGDKGSACGTLAAALERAGRVPDAVAALRRGLDNARFHRHLALAASLEEDLARLSG